MFNGHHRPAHGYGDDLRWGHQPYFTNMPMVPLSALNSITDLARGVVNNERDGIVERNSIRQSSLRGNRGSHTTPVVVGGVIVPIVAGGTGTTAPTGTPGSKAKMKSGSKANRRHTYKTKKTGGDGRTRNATPGATATNRGRSQHINHPLSPPHRRTADPPHRPVPASRNQPKPVAGRDQITRICEELNRIVPEVTKAQRAVAQSHQFVRELRDELHGAIKTQNQWRQLVMQHHDSLFQTQVKIQQAQSALKDLELVIDAKATGSAPTLIQPMLGSEPLSLEPPLSSPGSPPPLLPPSSLLPTCADTDHPQSPLPSSPRSPMERATDLLLQNRQLEEYLTEHIRNLRLHETGHPIKDLPSGSQESNATYLGLSIPLSRSTRRLSLESASLISTPGQLSPDPTRELTLEEDWEKVSPKGEEGLEGTPELPKKEDPTSTQKEKTKYPVLLETLDEE